MLFAEDDSGDTRMNCEDFTTVGLDPGFAKVDDPLQKAAIEHLRECPRCAALHENWLALHEDLRILGAETAGFEAPSRVEMRLRQEFRTKHKTVKARRAAVILGWGMAAAAALFFAVTLANWRLRLGANLVGRRPSIDGSIPLKQDAPSALQGGTLAASEIGDVLVASNSSGDFSLLPDSMPPVPEDATVVRVQMQRAALGSLGLTVNEEHAGDWIQVDLLVGDDGLPQAVRLPQTSESTN
jgi:hypothetical protein